MIILGANNPSIQISKMHLQILTNNFIRIYQILMHNKKKAFMKDLCVFSLSKVLLKQLNQDWQKKLLKNPNNSNKINYLEELFLSLESTGNSTQNYLMELRFLNLSIRMMEFVLIFWIRFRKANKNMCSLIKWRECWKEII